MLILQFGCLAFILFDLKKKIVTDLMGMLLTRLKGTVEPLFVGTLKKE